MEINHNVINGRCTKCGLGSSYLTESCLNETVPLEYIPKILTGRMDFRNNEWHELVNTGFINTRTSKILTLDSLRNKRSIKTKVL